MAIFGALARAVDRRPSLQDMVLERVLARAQERDRIMARYDAVATTADNAKWWANADDLTADKANSAAVRRTLRMRARYTTASDCYAFGLCLTVANAIVREGPRLQLQARDNTGALMKGANRLVEREFMDWCREISFARNLRIGHFEQFYNGEIFFLLITNPRLPTPVKLDIVPIETGLITDPTFGAREDPRNVDGVHLDEYDNEIAYSLVRDAGGYMPATKAEIIDAGYLLHSFQATRGGQHRGIPECTPALPRFMELRRYTNAVIDAAETAAELAGVIYSDQAPDDSDAPTMYDRVELERRLFTVLPDGWKAQHLKPEQPATTFGEFKREILSEILRCVLVPYGRGAGDHSSYNYSSAQMDGQDFNEGIDIRRSDDEDQVVNPLFRAWMMEAILQPNYIPLAMRALPSWPRQWIWRTRRHSDPLKVANARKIELQIGTTTLPAIYAEDGEDWESALTQGAEAMGVTIEEYQAMIRNAIWAKPAAAGGGAAGEGVDTEQRLAEVEEQLDEQRGRAAAQR